MGPISRRNSPGGLGEVVLSCFQLQVTLRCSVVSSWLLQALPLKINKSGRERPTEAQCSISPLVAQWGQIQWVSAAAPRLHCPPCCSACLTSLDFTKLKKFLHVNLAVALPRSVLFLHDKAASPASNGLQEVFEKGSWIYWHANKTHTEGLRKARAVQK